MFTTEDNKQEAAFILQYKLFLNYLLQYFKTIFYYIKLLQSHVERNQNTFLIACL